MHTMRKAKTQVTRICPSTLQYIVLSPGFTCVHIELQLHSHHSSHCYKYIQIPWPLHPPLYIPGKTSTVGSCVSLGTNQLTVLPSVTNLSVPQNCTFRLYLPGRALVLFPFFTPFHPPLPIHSQLTNTPHMSLRNQKPLRDLSYLLTTQSEPGVHLLLFPQRKSICPPLLGPWIPCLWLMNVWVLFASPSACISNFFLSAGSFSSV